jgi:hypothetical protein
VWFCRGETSAWFCGGETSAWFCGGRETSAWFAGSDVGVVPRGETSVWFRGLRCVSVLVGAVGVKGAFGVRCADPAQNSGPERSDCL